MTMTPDEAFARAYASLNPEQRQVVEHGEGPLLVQSVAGSGKTHAVTVRIARLVRSGVPDHRILAVTFAKKAGDEMTERVRRYLGSRTRARVGTFHSVAYEIVRGEMEGIDRWEIDTSSRYRICIKDAVGFKNMNWKDADVSFLESWITVAKAELAEPGSQRAKDLAREWYAGQKERVPSMVLAAYAKAEELREERHLLTFDDMLVYANRLMAKEDIRQRWAGRYDYVVSDEAQDQSHSMEVLGEALAKDHRNYVMIGDVNQSVYAWRGAHPEMLLGFKAKWNAPVIEMGRNYRCAPEIIDAANRVIEAMDPEQRSDTRMIAEYKPPQPAEITVSSCEDFDDEAAEIAETISRLVADGVKYEDIAILYRTNAQSRAPEEAFIGRRFPYHVVGGVNFYERREVRDLLAYLRAAAGGSMEDVSRCINTPTRYLGKAFIEKVAGIVQGQPKPIDWTAVMTAAAEKAGVHAGQRRGALEWASIIHYLRDRIRAGGTEAAPAKLLEHVYMVTKYADWLVKEEGQESTENNRISNCRELLRAAARFATVADLLGYIDETIAASKKGSGPKPGSITLSSCHRCVHPDTLVETPEGVHPIRDLPSTGTIATAAGPRAYRNKVSYKERDLLTIRTDCGYEITVTRDHGMMVWDGTEYVRREAALLRKNDFLRLRLGAVIEPPVAAVLPTAPVADVRARRYRFPSEVTAEVAEFLGLFVADGTVYDSGFRLKKRHKDVCDRFGALAAAIFGCDVRYSNEPSVTVGDRTYAAEVNSTQIAAWLVSVGGLAPRAKAIPQCILGSPLATQAHFLRGLFEDGTVNLTDETKADHIAWHTSYENMGRMMQVLLLRLGIISTRFPTNEGWRVAIYGHYIRVFRERVGFVAGFKRARLNLNVGEDTRNLVPVDRAWVRREISRAEHCFDRQNACLRGYVSRRVAQRWGLNEALTWHHERIASITATRGPAMCVEVPEHGRFLQSGFDGANSKGLEWPVVFLIGANDKVLPHICGDIEEERRLFYVGITRAKDRLYLSSVRVVPTAKGPMALGPSQFLSEAGLVPEPTL